MTMWQIGRTTTKPQRSSGFTLLELLFVIFIIALAIGIGVPKLNQVTSVNLRSSARTLANLIKYSYSRAVLSRSTLRVAVDMREGTYWVEQYRLNTPKPPTEEQEERLDGDKKPPHGMFEKESSFLSKPGRLGDGVKVVAYNDPKREQNYADELIYLYFYPQGETNGGRLVLKANDEVAITLFINPMTGVVKTVRGEVNSEDET